MRCDVSSIILGENAINAPCMRILAVCFSVGCIFWYHEWIIFMRSFVVLCNGIRRIELMNSYVHYEWSLM